MREGQYQLVLEFQASLHLSEVSFLCDIFQHKYQVSRIERELLLVIRKVLDNLAGKSFALVIHLENSFEIQHAASSHFARDRV
jgi:hypothetical protein